MDSKKALDVVGAFAGNLVTGQCKSREDAIVVAAALIEAAQLIFHHVGGKRLAAEQFYAAADRNTWP